MALPPDLARLPGPTQGRRSNRYRGLPSRRGRVTRPRKSHQALLPLGLQKLFKGAFNDGRFGIVRVQSLQRGQRGQRARLEPISHLVPCKSCQFYHPLPLYHYVLTSRKPPMYNCCVGSAVPRWNRYQWLGLARCLCIQGPPGTALPAGPFLLLPLGRIAAAGAAPGHNWACGYRGPTGGRRPTGSGIGEVWSSPRGKVAPDGPQQGPAVRGLEPVPVKPAGGLQGPQPPVVDRVAA